MSYGLIIVNTLNESDELIVSRMENGELTYFLSSICHAKLT